MKFYRPDSRKLTASYWCICEGNLYAMHADHLDDRFTQRYITTPVYIESNTSPVPLLYLTLLGRNTTLYEY